MASFKDHPDAVIVLTIVVALGICASAEAVPFAGGTGMTAEQMQQQAGFGGWDFENVWTICEGRDYPRLRWEGVECGGQQ